MKLVSMDRAEALSLGKSIFVYEGEVCLVYLNDTCLDGVSCAYSAKDFRVIQGKGYKDEDLTGDIVLDFGDDVPNMRELLYLQKKHPNVRFEGTGLMLLDELKYGFVPDESLCGKLSCRFRGTKSFLHKPKLKLVNVWDGFDQSRVEDFSTDTASEDGVRFGVVQKTKKVGMKRGKAPSKKPLFSAGKVVF